MKPDSGYSGGQYHTNDDCLCQRFKRRRGEEGVSWHWVGRGLDLCAMLTQGFMLSPRHVETDSSPVKALRMLPPVKVTTTDSCDSSKQPKLIRWWVSRVAGEEWEGIREWDMDRIGHLVLGHESRQQ